MRTTKELTATQLEGLSALMELGARHQERQRLFLLACLKELGLNEAQPWFFNVDTRNLVLETPDEEPPKEG